MKKYSMMESYSLNPENIKSLLKLLNPEINSSDSEEDEQHDKKDSQRIGPGHIVNSAISSNQNVEKIKEIREAKESSLNAPTNDDKDDIEKWLEKQHQEDSEILEKRKRPEYEIKYKQAIGTEDVFLQMNNRTSASMSCEDMIINIYMPDETIAVEEMDLKITNNEIDLKSSVYRLKLSLMHKVDPDKGQAKFDSDTKTLTLVLRIKRELDFINF